MKMRYELMVILWGASIALAQAAGLQVLHPVGYESNGAQVAGWNWLRREGDFAEWTFDVSGLEEGTHRVMFCFDALSTNKPNGGAGYNSKLQVVWPKKRSLTLRNECTALRAFERYYNGDSRGIGYESHGCYREKIVVKRHLERDSRYGSRHWVTEPVRVVVKYRPRNHTAVNKGSLQMIFIE